MWFIKSLETKFWEAQEGAGRGLWHPYALNAGTGTQREGTAMEEEYGLYTLEVWTSWV